MLAGQETVGPWVSLTVTVNEHCAVLPKKSVTVQVTVVTPFGKVDPGDGEQATEHDSPCLGAAGAFTLTGFDSCGLFPPLLHGQSAGGGVKSKTAVHLSASVDTEKSSEQVIVGVVVQGMNS